jgi:outer membrane protein assembly factor BamB
MIAFLRGIHPRLLLCALLALSSLSGCANPPADERSSAGSTGWKVKLDGSGSRPVIADGVLYVGSADGAVYALDSKTGRMKWRFQTGEGLSSVPQVIAVPPGTSVAGQMSAAMTAAEKQRATGTRRVDMTPAVENGTVFIGAGDHSFYAIDVATGKKKWSYLAGFGMASNNNTSREVPAPILMNGTAYFVTEEGLHALDAITGDRKWLFETLQEIPVKDMNLGRKRTPAGPVVGNGVLYLTARPFGGGGTAQKSFLYAVDPDSGKATWVTSMDDIDITEPVAAKGLVFVATRPSIVSNSGRATLYAINATDGHIKWKVEAERKFGSSRLLVAGSALCFSTDKSVSAMELESGRRLWSASADELLGDLRADDQHLYVIAHKGSLAHPRDTLRALALTTGQENWSYELGGPGYSLVVQDGVVYAGYFHAIDAVTGKRVWSFKGTGRESAPVIAEGKMFVTTPTVEYSGTSRVDQGYLYAIEVKTGKP